MRAEGGFALPAPSCPVYLEDDGEWHSLGDLLAPVPEELRPRDREGMLLFLACYDAWPAAGPAA